MNIADKMIKETISNKKPYYKVVNGVWYYWDDVKKEYVEEK